MTVAANGGATAKRLFDVCVSVAAFILLSPLLGFLAILVRMKLGSPIIWREKRPGLNAVPFTLLKFRTMSDRRDATGKLLPDGERLTRFGKVLRSTSLDELPELINVIRGEMSLVGPRPLRMEYLTRYSPEQMRRHGAIPGITGWAQINGRNAISWEQKFALDVWYVENRTFFLDLKILVRTFWKSLRREDINHPGSATAEEFLGTKETAAEQRQS